MGEDDGRRVARQGQLDDLAGIDRRLGQSAPEQLDVINQAMLGIEQHHPEDLMRQTGEAQAQVVADVGGVGVGITGADLLAQRPGEQFLGDRQGAAGAVAHAIFLNSGRSGVQREEIRQRVPGKQGIGVLAQQQAQQFIVRQVLNGGDAAVAFGGSGHGSESFRQKSKSPDDREGHRGERCQKGKAGQRG